MRRFRNSHRLELGEAISFEDVLTVIAVLLLLRVLFMVPLVNLDKAKTVRAKGDSYWSRQVAFVLAKGSHANQADSLALLPYRTAFDLAGSVSTRQENGNAWLIESASLDSNLAIFKHQPSDSSYIAMRIQAAGHGKSFQRGKLYWSEAELAWFTAADSIDYGDHASSKAFETELRNFTKSQRGY